MKLSVIITCYDRDPNRAINSIKNQVGYYPDEVEIILSLDSPGVKFKISNVILVETGENTGVSGARQRGLDVACGEYVTFMDDDDVWFNLLGYTLFLKDLYFNENEYDIMKFGILEQLADGAFKPIVNDSTWCFGKIYRREFLIENGIRFNEELKVHDDSCFVRTSELFSPKIVNHGDFIYLWSCNPDSQTRINGGIYWQAEFDEYIKCLLIIRDEKVRRKIPYDAAYDLAYCYSSISRMDDQYIDECIKVLKGSVPDWIECAADRGFLGCRLVDAEAANIKRGIIPKFSLDAFVEMIK